MAASVPRVSAVLETSLYVADLDRACDFYQRVFGFERFVHDGRMCALGVPGSQVLLLFRHGSTNEPAPVPGGVIPPHHGSGELHLCFAIPTRRVGRVGGTPAAQQHCGRKPDPLGARRHQPVFPRSRRQFAGGRNSWVVAQPLNERTVVAAGKPHRRRTAAGAGAGYRCAAMDHA